MNEFSMEKSHNAGYDAVDPKSCEADRHSTGD